MTKGSALILNKKSGLSEAGTLDKFKENVSIPVSKREPRGRTNLAERKSQSGYPYWQQGEYEDWEKRLACELQRFFAVDIVQIFSPGQRPSRPDPLMARMIEDEKFFLAQLPGMLSSHRGQYVAIRKGKIIGFADSRRALEDIIKQKCGKVSVFVERVSEEALAAPEEQSIFIEWAQ